MYSRFAPPARAEGVTPRRAVEPTGTSTATGPVAPAETAEATGATVRTATTRALARSLVAASFAALVAAPASAHGVPGGEVTLEGIPNWLYLSAGGLVVLLSFVIVGLFAGRAVTDGGRRRARRVAVDFSPAWTVIRVAALLAYLGVVVLGLVGPNAFQFNAAPSLVVEIVWWVGLGIVAILVANLWPVLDPWKTVFEWLGEPSLDRPYPARLGALPALVGFLVFAWLNMVVLAFSVPRLVSLLALGYGGLMLAGMAVYGKETWLWNADAFTRVFDFFGRFAPVVLREGGLELRRYASGLVADADLSRTEVLFVVAMLYTLSFDGFKETPAYFELFAALPSFGLSPLARSAFVGGALLLAGYALFVAAYAAFAWLMKRAARSPASVDAVMRRFVLTLVPIAVAYHVAHYSLYYLLQHELVLGALANPLPADGIVPDPDLLAGVTPAMVWLWMVGLIVLGHVVAVWVSHRVSLDYFVEHATAVRSQIPMMGLMVFYTVVSLWIISQPFGG